MVKTISRDDEEMVITIDLKRMFSGRAINIGGFQVELEAGDFANRPKAGEEIASLHVRLLWPPEQLTEK